MTSLDILSVVHKADDPLQFALRLANSLQEPEERFAVLTEALAQYDQRCDAAVARQIVRLAEDLHTSEPERAHRLLKALPENGNLAAAKWMRAALLEAAERYGEAAAAFDDISDTGWDEYRAIRLLSRARNLIKTEAWSDAGIVLREAVKAASSYRTLCAADRLVGRLKGHDEIPFKRHCKIALVGSMILDFLVPALRASCFAEGIDAEIYQGAFGQYQQEILDPHSGLAAFAPDVVIIATDWRTLGLPDETDDPSTVTEAQVSMFRNLWYQCRERLDAFVIQHNFEIPATDPYGRLSAALEGGRARLLRQINLNLWDAEQEEAGVAILDVEQIAAIYGKASWSDSVLWHAAKQYPAPDAIPLLTRHQTALLRAVLGLSAKCLVLDLDGTLWGGVIGEDGLSGIELGGSAAGESFVAFQRYVQSLQRRGIILAVCSKNNEEDAKLPFRTHPEMVLSLDDITMFVANWRPKDENLRLIADTINIGLDSLVFVDDSPTERAWVRRQLPEIEVPEMPEDPALYIQTLDRQRCFEALSLTEDDRRRVESYRGNVQRKVFETASTSLEEFLAGLQMQVELRPFDESNLPRIAQLINKTNQFNLTTRRLSESQVRGLINSPGCYTQYMRLRDRFGDNGLTGVLIALEEEDGLRIDNWLMSCRVLGRQVEEVMLGALIRYASAHGVRYVIGEYVPTAKNEQVRDLFDRLGFERIVEGPDGERKYRWDLFERAFEWPDFFRVDDRTQSP